MCFLVWWKKRKRKKERRKECILSVEILIRCLAYRFAKFIKHSSASRQRLKIIQFTFHLREKAKLPRTWLENSPRFLSRRRFELECSYLVVTKLRGNFFFSSSSSSSLP